MESQILEYGSNSYQVFAERKANTLNVKYLNEHHGEEVVPLEVVTSILKDIELRLENRNEDSDVENLYQDI